MLLSLRLLINLMALLTVVLLGATSSHGASGHDDHGIVEQLHAQEVVTALNGEHEVPESPVHCGSPLLIAGGAEGYCIFFGRTDFHLSDALPQPCRPAALDPRPPRA